MQFTTGCCAWHSQDALSSHMLLLPAGTTQDSVKLRPGGPPAIRSPEHLQGLPSNSASQQARVKASQQLLYRCTCILRAVFAAGGHVSLEQPTHAMSWLEPFVQSFLAEIQAALVVIPACSVGQDISKSWLFATSFAGLSHLAAKCEHGDSHTQVAGALDEQGHFLSQRTAEYSEYPHLLASKFCSQVRPLSGATFCRVTGKKPQFHPQPRVHASAHWILR